MAATTIDTATAEEDVKDFDVPEKNLTGFDQVLLLSALCKQVRDEVEAQSKSLTSSSSSARRGLWFYVNNGAVPQAGP